MKRTIEKYFKYKMSCNGFVYEDTELLKKGNKEIIEETNNLTKPLLRKTKTDLKKYKEEFGYDLPNEIADYINIYWHTYITGFYDDCNESIILFPVLKFNHDTDDDILYYKYFGIIEMAKSWKKIGDVNKYLPVGWLGESGSWILYEIMTGKIYLEDIDSDIEGKVSQNPIANNLKELISCLKFI